MMDNQAFHTPITPAYNRSGEPLARPLPEGCPSPSAPNDSYGDGVMARRAGEPKIDPGHLLMSNSPAWRSYTVGWIDQDTLARSEGYA